MDFREVRDMVDEEGGGMRNVVDGVAGVLSQTASQSSLCVGTSPEYCLRKVKKSECFLKSSFASLVRCGYELQAVFARRYGGEKSVSWDIVFVGFGIVRGTSCENVFSGANGPHYNHVRVALSSPG